MTTPTELEAFLERVNRVTPLTQAADKDFVDYAIVLPWCLNDEQRQAAEKQFRAVHRDAFLAGARWLLEQARKEPYRLLISDPHTLETKSYVQMADLEKLVEGK